MVRGSWKDYQRDSMVDGAVSERRASSLSPGWEAVEEDLRWVNKTKRLVSQPHEGIRMERLGKPTFDTS